MRLNSLVNNTSRFSSRSNSTLKMKKRVKTDVPIAHCRRKKVFLMTSSLVPGLWRLDVTATTVMMLKRFRDADVISGTSRWFGGCMRV